MTYFETAFGFAFAFAAIFVWAQLCSLILDSAHRRITKTIDAKVKNKHEDKAKQLIRNNKKVRSIYFSLRLLHLKNKQTNKVSILEQQLRTAVRDKVTRQEIIQLARKKNVQI